MELSEIKQTPLCQLKKKHLIRLIEAVRKDLDSKTSSNTYNHGRAQSAEKELKELHDLFDNIEGILPHKKEDGFSHNTLATRVMSLMVKLSGINKAD